MTTPIITLNQQFFDTINSKAFRCNELKEILELLGERKYGKKQDLVIRTLTAFRRLVDLYNKDRTQKGYDALVTHLRSVETLSRGTFNASSVISGDSNISHVSSVKIINGQNNLSNKTTQRTITSNGSWTDSSVNLKKRKREEEVSHPVMKKKKELFQSEGVNIYGHTLRYLSEYKIRIDLPDDPFFDIIDMEPLAIMHLEKRRVAKFQQQQYQNMDIDLSSEIWELIKRRQARVQVRCFEVKSYKILTIVDHIWPDEIIIRINKAIAPVDKYDKKRCTIDLPCDITPFLTEVPNLFSVFHNSDPTHSDKQYCIVLQLVKVTTSDDLIKRVSSESLLTWEQSLERVKSSFSGDDDIIEMERKIPIFDPLQRTLIKIPAISKDCRHIQCFDLMTYIKMNERLRRWKCPVCNSKARYHSLFTDPYFQKILEQADEESSKEVVICPNGDWRFEKEEDEVQSTHTIEETIINDDEYIIIDISSSED